MTPITRPISISQVKNKTVSWISQLNRDIHSHSSLVSCGVVCTPSPTHTSLLLHEASSKRPALPSTFKFQADLNGF